MSDYLLGLLTIPAALLVVGVLAWAVLGIANLTDEVRMLIARRRNN